MISSAGTAPASGLRYSGSTPQIVNAAIAAARPAHRSGVGRGWTARVGVGAGHGGAHCCRTASRPGAPCASPLVEIPERRPAREPASCGHGEPTRPRAAAARMAHDAGDGGDLLPGPRPWPHDRCRALCRTAPGSWITPRAGSRSARTGRPSPPARSARSTATSRSPASSRGRSCVTPGPRMMLRHPWLSLTHFADKARRVEHPMTRAPANARAANALAPERRSGRAVLPARRSRRARSRVLEQKPVAADAIAGPRACGAGPPPRRRRRAGPAARVRGCGCGRPRSGSLRSSPCALSLLTTQWCTGRAKHATALASSGRAAFPRRGRRPALAVVKSCDTAFVVVHATRRPRTVRCVALLGASMPLRDIRQHASLASCCQFDRHRPAPTRLEAAQARKLLERRARRFAAH